MKYYYKFLLILVSSTLIASCADDFNSSLVVEKPESIAQYEYLNAYDALKSYVNRNTDPNFKLGSGITVSDFLNKGLVYSLACANFDELTAGNAMKYGSVVSDDGSMNFSQVMKFVNAAQAAGINIYGHTLGWHSQQNNKYLNSLIADKIAETDDADNCLHINTPNANTNIWDWQIFYIPSTPLTVGVTYTITMRVKASSTTVIEFWPTDGTNVKYGLTMTAGEQWSDVTMVYTPDFAANKLQFCFGKFGGDIYFDDISMTAADSDINLFSNGSFDEENLTGWDKPSWHSYTFSVEAIAAGPATWWTNLVSNSDCESDDTSCLYVTEIGVGPKAATFGAAGTGYDGVGRAVVVQSGDDPSDEWDTQFFVKVPHTFQSGEPYRFSMKVRADKNANISSQAHNNPGVYLHWSMVGSPSVTTEWQEYNNSGIISDSQSGMNTIAFNLSVSSIATTYYFDDVRFEMEESGNSIPQTPEEKADTLTWAMSNWIRGMMDACSGYVTAWEVVNEAVSGTDLDGDGYYDLHSATRGTVSASDAEKNFYWQDYLGDDEYIRKTVKYARQYFSESGGSPSDLKLFINDYNLESNWDDNKKLKSLIHWIDRWESDGVTKIDGIGTQMHVSYYMNSDTQKSKEDHVVKMYELLAASGKLVKVTELDMGIVDESGNSIKTENVTFEQHQLMADYYKFIVEKFFEIIPVNQRYGIAHWCPTDSPENSWRGGEPVGIWDANYNRKPAYGGIADGLSGK